ncbi:MAG TPA: sigma factor [Pyrinomonadaceae bacterium]|nr:sigma factor [Pyrinomonadaceae bacterium]
MTTADDDKRDGGVVTAEAANKKEPTDYELAQRSAKGDGDAFEQIYRRHFRRVYALCLRMMSDPVRAEDMTQEVFVQLFNTIGS